MHKQESLTSCLFFKYKLFSDPPPPKKIVLTTYENAEEEALEAPSLQSNTICYTTHTKTHVAPRSHSHSSSDQLSPPQYQISISF